MGGSSPSRCVSVVRVFPYEELPDADLIVDAIYEGKTGGQLSGEALSHLLPGIGNLGGFRAAGRGYDKRFVVLYTSGEDRDWPDHLDTNSGRFLYYGDNKRPGRELHDTRPGGNRILRYVFDLLHDSPSQRRRIPPFLIFEKCQTNISARSFQFRGLAVPGFVGLSATEDLIAIWKTSDGQRFQNYRAVFTVLDAPQIRRAWIDALSDETFNSPHAPDAWKDWIARGSYRALAAESTTIVRSHEAQLPKTETKAAILQTVWQHFRDSPRNFERFAARLFTMHDPRVVVDEITQYAVDGGRDAVGRYSLGLSDDPVYVEFSLEAKCYRPPSDDQPPNSVGVKEVSRLISRIRHRQFGVLGSVDILSF